jgi:hypothetical protein
MSNTFEDAKIGDVVYSLQNGWGTVEGVSSAGLAVKFELNDQPGSPIGYHKYSFTGWLECEIKYSDINQSLLNKSDQSGPLFDLVKTNKEIRDLYWDIPNIIAPNKKSYKLINGHKIEDISYNPGQGDDYYYPDVASPFLYSIGYCGRDVTPEVLHRSKLGMCYPDSDAGQQAAIAHAKALLNYKE